ncbi:hypothetical protein CROQUDRAFT_670749 [Cronartium quercuum f. sp. fusiforme G11]|uniref:Uncharacterized protein n=1 Tax=Cronartium quercuum f. sp. fusiforme G11 TaxID=708437 RepID=A0A9P6NP45_9BASI|nr:hypothetical protein CROQUDRAFT_670749 [Cronartium quercuum f. sp. fusiforme G11]
MYTDHLLHSQAILNTTQVDSDWSLDPRPIIKSLLGSTPKAAGNSVSVEFNTLYRWHAPLSWSQTQWLESTFGAALPSKNWDEMTEGNLRQAVSILKKKLNAEAGSEPRNWKLSKYETRVHNGGLPEVVAEGVYERDPETGKFRDEDIAKILKDATNEVAGAFGARHVPAVMKWVECAGMRTARDVWKTATLNEFRAFMGLQEFSTFLEWNSDPTIASSMESLVGHPSNIPLHVGLHGEEAKKPRVGAGVCLPYTISRAILSDAVALVRGDRFYTDSATADTMTDWGLKECQSDSQHGAYGGMLERLISQNLPNQYAFNDVALMFPLIVPEHSLDMLSKISPQKALNYSLHQSPPPQVGYRHIQSGQNIMVYELSDTPEVEIQRMSWIFGLSRMNSNIAFVYKAVELVMSKQDINKYKIYIQSRIQQCSVKRSPVSNDATLDIARDVCNPLITGFLAHIFGLVETGIHSQQLLLCALSDIYYYLTEAPQISYKARSAARVAASELAWQIKAYIQASGSSNFSLGGLIKKGASKLTVGALDVLEDSIKLFSGKKHAIKHHHTDAKLFYQALKTLNNAQSSPLSVDELAADCLRVVSTLAYTIVNGTAHALDNLIPESTSKAGELPKLRSTLQDLIKSGNKGGSNEHYFRHALEGARLNHWNPSLRGMIVKAKHQGKQAHNRPIGIIDHEYRLDRDTSQYERLLDVDGHCLPVFENILPIIINQVFSLPKVRRSPGHEGKLDKIMITGAVAGVPTMHIRYDGTKA